MPRFFEQYVQQQNAANANPPANYITSRRTGYQNQATELSNQLQELAKYLPNITEGKNGPPIIPGITVTNRDEYAAAIFQALAPNVQLTPPLNQPPSQAVKGHAENFVAHFKGNTTTVAGKWITAAGEALQELETNQQNANLLQNPHPGSQNRINNNFGQELLIALANSDTDDNGNINSFSFSAADENVLKHDTKFQLLKTNYDKAEKALAEKTTAYFATGDADDEKEAKAALKHFKGTAAKIRDHMLEHYRKRHVFDPNHSSQLFHEDSSVKHFMDRVHIVCGSPDDNWFDKKEKNTQFWQEKRHMQVNGPDGVEFTGMLTNRQIYEAYARLESQFGGKALKSPTGKLWHNFKTLKNFSKKNSWAALAACMGPLGLIFAVLYLAYQYKDNKIGKKLHKILDGIAFDKPEHRKAFIEHLKSLQKEAKQTDDEFDKLKEKNQNHHTATFGNN